MAAFTVTRPKYVQVDFTTAGDTATVTGKIADDAEDAALYSLAYDVDGPSIIIFFETPLPIVTVTQTGGTGMVVNAIQEK